MLDNIKNNKYNQTINKKFFKLMFLRVLIVTFLLSLTTLIQFKTHSLGEKSLSYIYIIIIAHYSFSFVYLLLFKKKPDFILNIYLQLITDNILIICLVYVTGGTISIYSLFFHMVILYSSLFLTLRDSIMSASLSSILYGTFIIFEFYGMIEPIYNETWQHHYSSGDIFSKIVTYIVSFYFVAFLVSFIAEKEKVARILLAKKIHEFDKLDYLHKSIIESVDLGILTTDLNANIKSMNKAARKITCLSFLDVYNQHLSEIFPAFHKVLFEIKKVGKTVFDDEIIYNNDNQDIILNLSISPLLDRNNIKIGEVFIFRDITSLKEMEKEAEKSKRLALIGEMAAGLAHEIRNPLASLSGSIQLLNKNLNLDVKNKRLFNIILRGRNQLENLVKDFLLLSRKSPESNEEILISTIIEEVIESLKYGDQWNENLKVRHIWNSERSVYGNKHEIKEIIWNLIINAVQSMSNGGTLTTRINKAFVKDKEYIAFQIIDTGCGIENNDFQNLFKPFYTTKERGTGLGLAIVNRITESHGGKLSVKSTLGKGTCFTVLLP